MKHAEKFSYRIIAVLLGAFLFLTGSCRAGRSSENSGAPSSADSSAAESAITSVNASRRRCVDSILDSMRENRFSALAKDLLATNSGANPVYANANGVGMDGIDRQPRIRYTEEEILTSTKKYIENIFGEHAWENVTYTIESARGIDPDQFLVSFTFNGLDIAPTGEGGVQIIVRKDPDAYRITQSFSWRTEEDEEYRGRSNLKKGVLKDNSDTLPPQITHLIAQFINAVEKNDDEWIASKIKEKLSVWRPDSKKDYPSTAAILSDQIGRYQAYARQSHLSSPKISAYVIDCLNDAKYCTQAWFDANTKEQLSEADAKKRNDDFIIRECLKYGIHYDAAQNGANLTEEELRIMEDHQISSGYYPVQPVGSFVNRYVLYKINLIFDDLPNDRQEYFSFYISNQDGFFDVISSLYCEPVYECGISVQDWGD